eukprot:UN27231
MIPEYPSSIMTPGFFFNNCQNKKYKFLMILQSKFLMIPEYPSSIMTPGFFF